MKRYLIGQLGVYGDCLYATTIARQIKTDYPECHLTWAIGSSYRNILDNNPYVDCIWEYPIKTRLEAKTKWFDFVKEAVARKEMGEFDEIYFTQAYPGNPNMFYGSLRASMFRIIPNKITVPIDPVVRLSPNEIKHVLEFALDHNLYQKKNVILFECSPQSNQSFLTIELVMDVAKEIVDRFPNTCIILSGAKSIISGNANIIDGSVLTFRENAELTKYCTLFIGTGSGITQICMSDSAKPLPMIQLLQQGTVASVISDREYFELPTDQIIEMTKCSSSHIIDCVTSIFLNGFEISKKTYCKKITPDFNIIRFHMMFDTAIITGKYMDILPAFIDTCKRYGFGIGLIRFLSTFPSSIWILISRKIKGVK